MINNTGQERKIITNKFKLSNFSIPLQIPFWMKSREHKMSEVTIKTAADSTGSSCCQHCPHKRRSQPCFPTSLCTCSGTNPAEQAVLCLGVTFMVVRLSHFHTSVYCQLFSSEGKLKTLNTWPPCFFRLWLKSKRMIQPLQFLGRGQIN